MHQLQSIANTRNDVQYFFGNDFNARLQSPMKHASFRNFLRYSVPMQVLELEDAQVNTDDSDRGRVRRAALRTRAHAAESDNTENAFDFRRPQNPTTEIKLISKMQKDVSVKSLNRSLQNIHRYVQQSIDSKKGILMIRARQVAQLAEQLLSFKNIDDESFSLFVSILTLHLTISTNHKDVLDSFSHMIEMHAKCNQYLLQQLNTAYDSNISNKDLTRSAFEKQYTTDCKTKLKQLLQDKCTS
jgi:hypothetical protein